jgi:hypothetical protein
VRRTVATLLVVASPLLMAAPVGAREVRAAAPTVGPAVPAVMPLSPVAVAVPAPPVAVTPAAPVPVPGLARAAAAVRPAVRAVRAKAAVSGISDAAYAAQLQAALCQARAIFCGLDRGGHYPAG